MRSKSLFKILAKASRSTGTVAVRPGTNKLRQLRDMIEERGGKIHKKEVEKLTLTVEEASEIYRVDYYDAYRCGELPEALGLCLFDAVVNHRPGTAVKPRPRAERK